MTFNETGYESGGVRLSPRERAEARALNARLLKRLLDEAEKVEPQETSIDVEGKAYAIKAEENDFSIAEVISKKEQRELSGEEETEITTKIIDKLTDALEPVKHEEDTQKLSPES